MKTYNFLALLLVITNFTLPVSAVTLNKQSIKIKINSTVNNQANYQQLQKQLIFQNKYEEALLIAERSQGRALNVLTHLSHNNKQLLQSYKAPNIEEIKQVAKQQNATLVQYSIIYNESKESELYIWVIKPTGEIKFSRVDLKPLWQKEKTSLKDLVTATRNDIGIYSKNAKGITIDKEPPKKTPDFKQLQRLHQLLIAPIAELLPKNINEKVIFIPQSTLFLVPFPALKDASGKYLIEQHAISTAPSIQVLSLVHSKRRPTNIKNALIIGNPDTVEISKPGEKPQKLSSLPGAEEEAKAIAKIFNTEALVHQQATKNAVLQRMPTASIIHLATRICYEDNQELEAIYLTPDSIKQQESGILTAEEIINLKLNADLVVLSGGASANGKITGDGVIGLPRAFIAAGAKTVVGSIWEISDKPTVLLMTEFYKNLQTNPDKSQALQKAMLTMKKQYPNPRDWAAFTLIGDTL